MWNNLDKMCVWMSGWNVVTQGIVRHKMLSFFLSFLLFQANGDFHDEKRKNKKRPKSNGNPHDIRDFENPSRIQ